MQTISPALTTKQFEILKEVKAKWLGPLISPKGTDRGLAEDAINRFYSINKRANPEIVWAESVVDAFCLLASKKEKLKFPIVNEWQIRDQYMELSKSVSEKLSDTLDKELGRPILIESHLNVEIEMDNDQVELSASKKKAKSIGALFDSGVAQLINKAEIASYNHLHQFALIDYYNRTDLTEDRWMQALGECLIQCSHCWFFDGVVVVVGMPESIDQQRREDLRTEWSKGPSLLEAAPRILMMLGCVLALVGLTLKLPSLLFNSSEDGPSERQRQERLRF